jgi:serine/threonine-protein kinase
LRERFGWPALLAIFFGSLAGAGVLAVFVNFVVMPWIVRSGNEVEVPEVVGLSRADTKAVLERAGLRLGRVDLKVSSDIQPDAVITQNPPAGKLVKAGREIMVVLSQGPLRIEVPELRGISLRNARLLLNESDLAVGLQSQVHHPDYSFGTVIAQYPLPGVLVAPSTEVLFLTSLGPEEEGWTLPDLEGRRLSSIRTLIRDSKPVRYNVADAVDPDQPPGVVVGQSPLPGSYVGPDSTVTLRVTAGR